MLSFHLNFWFVNIIPLSLLKLMCYIMCILTLAFLFEAVMMILS